jgi:hypothetical protein
MPEVPEAFSEARAVFIGEVVDIVEPRTNNPRAPLADRLYAIKFKIERSWKGVSNQEVVVLSDQGRAGCFSWGSFVKGQRYLVYAERHTPSGAPLRKLAVLFSCNRTTLITVATEDLKKLERLRVSTRHGPKRSNGEVLVPVPNLPAKSPMKLVKQLLAENL